MKLSAIVFTWYLQVQSSEKTEWYVEFYSDDNTIHKCGRDEYNEIMELMESNKYEKQYQNIIYNESLSYTELPSNTKINGHIHDYKSIKKPKTIPIYIY